MSVERLTDRAAVRQHLGEMGIRPSKRLGQNFLVDPSVVSAIAEIVSQLQPEMILEIGPGLGGITTALVPLAGQVIAVERDRRLAKRLEATFAETESVEIRQEDVLRVDFAELAAGRSMLVVGSIPYSITAPILRHLVRHRNVISSAVMLTQLEVAEKLAASPGADGSSLGVFVRAYADVEIHRTVGRHAFYPAPDVDSALWTLRFRERPRFTADPEDFFTIVRTIYGARRKMLRGALRQRFPGATVDVILGQTKIDGTLRGETFGFDELDRLAHAISTFQKPSDPRHLER